MLLRLLRRTEKDPVRKDRYRDLLVRNAEVELTGAADYALKVMALPDCDLPEKARGVFEAAQAKAEPKGLSAAFALMAYWMERRHRILRN